MNCVVEWMLKNGLQMIVQNYLELAFMGEVKSLAKLARDFPEDFAEVEDKLAGSHFRFKNVVKTRP